MVIFFSLSWGSTSAGADTFRSGNPPSITKISVDAQRQVTVEFTALDGLKYAGFLFMDSDPRNATPVQSDPKYGLIMFCNNTYSCKGSWELPAPTSTEAKFSFTTPALGVDKFPPGTYYVQVTTKNEDPYASTRQEEFSNIVTIELSDVPTIKIADIIIPALAAIKIPISNGDPACIAGRNLLTIGNRLIVAINAHNAKLNSYVASLKVVSAQVKDGMALAVKQTAAVKAIIDKDVQRVKISCSKTPPLVSAQGAFIPIPIPPGNGTENCNTNRTKAVYTNKELMKVVNNLKTTKKDQTVRIHQLEVRFNQLAADLAKYWPLLLTACESKF
jgi:hypothetical protein